MASRGRWRIKAAGWSQIAAAVCALCSAGALLGDKAGASGLLRIALFGVAVVAAGAAVVLKFREQTEPRREREAGVRGWLVGHFLARARGVARAGERGDFFSGRTAAREEMVRWLTRPPAGDAGVCVVTGDPGSGKSAVIGRLVAQSDQRLRSKLDLRRDPPGTVLPEGTIDAFVHARGLTLEEVGEAIAVQVRAEGTDPELLAGERAAPRVVVVDALDEASGEGEARRVAQRLLRPLSQAGARVLVGTRRGRGDELIRALGAGREVVDLDDEHYLALEDLVDYVQRLLLRDDDPAASTPYRGRVRLARRVARAVAQQATPSFLVARLVARSLAEARDVVDVHQHGWEQLFPDSVADAMEDYLDRFDSETDRRRARALLGVLACAEGSGLPYGPDQDLWTVVAGAVHGRDFERADIAWLLDTPAADLIDVASGDPACYRLFHRALVDHLRPADLAAAQRRIARALYETAASAWRKAPAYIREQLATHAAAGDCVDELLTHAEYLLEAEPTRLLRALATLNTQDLADVRRIYRQAIEGLRSSSDRGERAAYLESAARQAGDDALADRFGALEPERPWATLWARWQPPTDHYILGRHIHVDRVAVGELEGRPIAVSAGRDPTLRVWDLASGHQHHQEFTEPTGGVEAIAVGELEGRAIAVTAHGVTVDREGRLSIWDLASGRRQGALTDQTGWVMAVAVGELEGRAIVVSAGHGGLRVWDLASGRQHGNTLTGHTANVRAVAMCELDGRPIAVSAAGTELRVWDLAAGRQHGDALTASTDVTALAVGEFEGRPIAASAHYSGNALRVWDLASGRQHGEALTGHTDIVMAIAVGHVEGQVVVVSASLDKTLRVWDLASRRQRGEALRGHTIGVHAVAIGEVEGRPVAVSAGDWDGTLRVWDLASVRDHGGSDVRDTSELTAVAVGDLDGQAIAVSGGVDGTLRVWDLASGRERGEVLTGHPSAVKSIAVGELGARPIAITAGYGDKTLRVWDLASGRQRGEALTGDTHAVTVAVGDLDGQAIAVSGGVDGTLRVWDLASGRQHGDVLTASLAAPVTALAMGQLEGRPIAVSAGSVLRVWDLATGRQLGEALRGHGNPVYALAITELEGRPIAVSAGKDRTLRVWDLASGRQRGDALTGHTGTVTALAITELEGRRIAVSAGKDGTVRVWDLASGQQRRTILLDIRTLAADPGGGLVMGADGGLLRAILQRL